ncbi:hypothetical protein EYR36_009073 [Pleurotus pulmonarius]|nr:hypothetical protein EYR36_009073 [Pleurotus pulmonarius]
MDTFYEHALADKLSIVNQGKLATLVNNAGTSDIEEASVGLQGIVCQVSLPPFAEHMGHSLRKLGQLRQGICITGLASPNFEAMLNNLRHTHSLFSRFTPGGRLRAYPTISAGNRFFTPTRLATGLQSVLISKEVDPHGLLKGADSKHLIHTDDNEVKYYVISRREAKVRYIPTSPIVFQVGDIVEIQVSMVSFPVSKQQGGHPMKATGANPEHTVKLILRSVLLLDGQPTLDAFAARSNASLTEHANPPRTKRRNVYDEDEGDPTEKRRQGMEV